MDKDTVLVLDGVEHRFPAGTTFEVTGKYAYTNKNFPKIVTRNLRHALGINLWRGTVWFRPPCSSSRKRLLEVWN